MTTPLSTRVNNAFSYLATQIKLLLGIVDTLNEKVNEVDSKKLDADGGIGTNIVLNGTTDLRDSDSTRFKGCLRIFHDGYTKGELKDYDEYRGILFVSENPNVDEDEDGDGVGAGYSYKNVVTGIESYIHASESGNVLQHQLKLGAFNPNANATDYSGPYVWINARYDSVNNKYIHEFLYNECPVIVKTAETKGTNWYRKYSDGWIEQGGSVTISSADQKVTMPIAFSNTEYSITASGGTKNNGGYGNTCCYSKTTTTFLGWTSDDSSFNAGVLQWYACGY